MKFSSAWSGRPLTVTEVDHWVCPVNIFFLDSAVDRSQHGARPFPGNLWIFWFCLQRSTVISPAVDHCPIFLQFLLWQMIRPIDYHKLLWHCVLSLIIDVLYSSKYTKISNNLPLFDDDKTLIYCNDIIKPTNMYATHWFHINKEIYTLTLQFAFTFYAGVKSICLTYEWWYVSFHFKLSPPMRCKHL